MSKRIMCLLSFALALGLVYTGYAAGQTVVYDFETGSQGWGGLKDGTGPTLSPETHSEGGSQSLRVTIDEAANGQQQGGWSSPRDFTAAEADIAAGGYTDLSFWYRVDNTLMNGGNFVIHWIMSTQGWSGGGWYGNGAWGAVIADGQWHQQTFDLSILGAAAGGWEGTWGDQTEWMFADDLLYNFEIAVEPTDNTTGSNMYIDDIQIFGSEEPPAPTSSVVVSDFESGLQGWYSDTWTAGTVSVGTTGATGGSTQAMLVEGPGGWQQLTKVNAKPYMETLAKKGVTITLDVTAFAADMTTTWMQVGMVINAQSDDGNGANNNVGWNQFDIQDVALDGQPHTLTWAIPDSLRGKIAGADDNIGWFELQLYSNVDGASVVKFYIDNIQLTYEAAPPVADKSTDVVIGNWEQDMDGWVVGGGAEPLFNDHNGVTLDNYSLDVWHQNSNWQELFTLDLVERGLIDAFAYNQKISVDITRLVADWPTDTAPNWGGFHMAINIGGANWNLWQDFGYNGNWVPGDGDQTTTVVWNYGNYLDQMDFADITWASFIFVSNYDPEYTGGVLFYLDNMKLFGGGAGVDPQPASGAIDVPIDSTLSWTKGAFATSHHVYFGTDLLKVRDADMESDPDVVFAAIDTNSFDPNGMEFKTQYFWRVDEVNEANPDSPWKGLVWNFTTGNFIVVDDFEDYNADENRIWYSWHDGLGYGTPDTDPYFAGNGTGSGSGDDTTPSFCEETIVHTGGKSMPVYFNNTGAAMISEVDRTWQEPQDWTINSFNALKLYTHGAPQNIAGELYVIVEDNAGNSAKVTNTDSTIFTVEEWKEWVISFSELANSNVNMTAVTKLLIGVQNAAGQPGANGKFYIDDIRIGFEPIGLVAYYAFDNNVEDSSGNGHHGTLAGDPNFPIAYVDGPAGLGQAALFDGSDDGHQYVDLGTFNPSAATDQLTIALWVKWDGPSESWQGLMGKRQAGDWDRDIMMWYFELERNAWDIRFYREGSGIATGQMLEVGQWTHVAVTFDGTTAKVYVDGVVAGEGSFSFGNDSEAPMQIGAAAENSGNPFNGTLDEVRIYDIALSEAEILQLAGK